VRRLSGSNGAPVHEDRDLGIEEQGADGCQEGLGLVGAFQQRKVYRTPSPPALLDRSLPALQQRRWCRSRSKSNCNGAELLRPLSKMFAVFDVMRGMNKDKSWMFAHFARREDFLPDAYDFVLVGVRRIVGNFVNAGGGNLISRLVHLSPCPSHRRLPCEESHGTG
jgi:hypothetical protein